MRCGGGLLQKITRPLNLRFVKSLTVNFSTTKNNNNKNPTTLNYSGAEKTAQVINSSDCKNLTKFEWGKIKVAEKYKGRIRLKIFSCQSTGNISLLLQLANHLAICSFPLVSFSKWYFMWISDKHEKHFN